MKKALSIMFALLMVMSAMCALSLNAYAVENEADVIVPLTDPVHVTIKADEGTTNDLGITRIELPDGFEPRLTLLFDGLTATETNMPEYVTLHFSDDSSLKCELEKEYTVPNGKSVKIRAEYDQMIPYGYTGGFSLVLSSEGKVYKYGLTAEKNNNYNFGDNFKLYVDRIVNPMNYSSTLDNPANRISGSLLAFVTFTPAFVEFIFTGLMTDLIKPITPSIVSFI